MTRASGARRIETLASRPNLETAYLMRDKFGFPVFYVIRNHGYALAPAN